MKIELKKLLVDQSCKFGISNSPQSPDIRPNSDGGISDFRISGQSLIKANCRNSRTSDDIDMKLEPVNKLDKRIKSTSKTFDHDVMSKIVTSVPFFQFMNN